MNLVTWLFGILRSCGFEVPRIMPLDVDKIKPKRGRSRLGCNNCKKSKVKCDEIHPSCTRCTKRGTVCSYPIQFAFQKSSVPVSKDTPKYGLSKKIIKLQTLAYNPEAGDANTCIEKDTQDAAIAAVDMAYNNSLQNLHYKENSANDILRKLILKRRSNISGEKFDFAKIVKSRKDTQRPG